MNMESKKIALVHDYLLRLGGAERVLKVLHDMFPNAPIYTVVYDRDFTEFFLGDCHNATCSALVHGSFFQKLPPFFRKRYKYFLPLVPSAVEQLDFSDFDLVISSCSAFIKGIITRPDAIHICYCHTPTRFLWDWTHPYSKSSKNKGIFGLLVRLTLHFLRFWDRQAAQRVDYFIANSKHVASRIKKYYGRDAKIIYPPVEMKHVKCETRDTGQDYFLIVSQLRSYKQIDIAIEAFKKLRFPLIIIGAGDDKKRLLKIRDGAKNISLLGFLSDREVLGYYEKCRAFVFPGEEDFGMTMVEAMYFGKPVLALRRGGAKEIVLEGVTGEFFDDSHPIVLADGVRRINKNYSNYDRDFIQNCAARFSPEKFKQGLLEFLDSSCKI